jgi:hypothetical protein
MTKHSKDAGLLKILRQNEPSLSVPPGAKAPSTSIASASEAPAHRKARTTHAAPPAIRGKAKQLWLHDEDERLIRELAVWLAPHRKRINDSLVIKAVLWAAKTGPELLEGYDRALTGDGRRPRPKKGTVETP